MPEMKTLTLNGKTYDSFVDKEARESIKNLSLGGSGTPGEDGGYYTPKVEQTDANTMKVSYTASKSGMPSVEEQSITLPAGTKGDKGDPGAQGAQGEQGIQGEKGEKGDTGETGAQGEPGKDGANGKDGTSATHSWNGTVLTVTSASGTSSANLKGAKGDKGDKGDTGGTGAPGPAGANGVSPTVEVSKTGKVTTLTITDANGTKTATINDGEDGAPGTSGGSAYTIPDYWQTEVDNVVNSVKSLQMGKNCITFPFFSDNHQRNGYAGMLIAEVMKRCNIPFCFYGGDSISSGYIASEAVMIAQDKAFDSIMSYIPNGRFCRTVGNHDGFWNVSSATGDEHHYTRDQVYELFMREESIAQNKHFGEDGTYYYVDDTASKVRFIVLNTNENDSNGGASVDSTQLAWLQNTALKFTESGWAVVLISHQPLSNHYHANISNATSVISAIQTYVDSTDENKADIVGCFSGHIHRDRIYTGIAVNTSDDSEGAILPFKQVTITSDHTEIAYEDATKHTVAEDALSHAIDFVTINKNTKTVNLTRLGIGNNRVYSYDNVVLYSITNTLTNVSNNNSVVSVEAEKAYTATLTPVSGYELSAVTVTMGGVDVTSSVYADGAINIASVTGDIVITATATVIVPDEPEPSYTNLADPTSADWSNDDRLSSSGEPKGTGTNPGHVVTNWIPATKGDVIRIKGIDIKDTTSGYAVQDKSGTLEAAKCASYNGFAQDTTGVWSFTVWQLTTTGAVYGDDTTRVRFSGLLTAASANDVIITRNEEIT